MSNTMKPSLNVSDETLDTPEQGAVPPCTPCMPVCGVSDEALDAPEQLAYACTCPLPCGVSDEALDAGTADVGTCVVTCVIPCRVSDEALDAPKQEAVSGCTVSVPCVVYCNIDGEDRASL